MTTDVVEAREWLQSWTDVSGLEGVVVKGMSQPYRPSVRGWTKVRRRDTAGRLHAIGRTVTLRSDAFPSALVAFAASDDWRRRDVRPHAFPLRWLPVTAPFDSELPVFLPWES
ncbi:hypothetical protein ABZ934_31720 [Streptomyces sp. NPDC046557]|uniref:hypothetical protein n=1 Tax=Streptomyces sp. NPDC046557 TaxID=3155372 RepID=UPI0033C83F29